MEEMTINAVSMLTSYGALGVVSIYFMIKDWNLNKKLNEALNDFTVVMNTFIKLEGKHE